MYYFESIYTELVIKSILRAFLLEVKMYSLNDYKLILILHVYWFCDWFYHTFKEISNNGIFHFFNIRFSIIYVLFFYLYMKYKNIKYNSEIDTKNLLSTTHLQVQFNMYHQSGLTQFIIHNCWLHACTLILKSSCNFIHCTCSVTIYCSNTEK